MARTGKQIIEDIKAGVNELEDATWYGSGDSAQRHVISKTLDCILEDLCCYAVCMGLITKDAAVATRPIKVEETYDN